MVEYEGEKKDIQEADHKSAVRKDLLKVACVQNEQSTSMHAHSYLYFVMMSSDEPDSLRLLKFHFRIDPYSGNIESNSTWAATINHARRNANLKPIVVNRQSHSPPKQPRFCGTIMTLAGNCIATTKH